MSGITDAGYNLCNYLFFDGHRCAY
ncbi:MAG: hypothetical protein DME54_03785 [Verrucomicrobia bacterium]|nr:MAG: hypothetical protein DMF09_05815 [Verrucomicrobiota bacterium]PYJ94008.1 MAG: hypothetical protein DME62_06620 [Verrucomicrobiota bacterium]PYK35775.1 MAG: hypothetical protein DME54_03785 [Verrucomicrobiota bacterium]PYL18579.1 MAG: hypothetical protein DMF41_12030 [Verrucomicrobiota bacterium]PYL82425.1 MAG: hypothetical protein DMF21_02425 [Verrucomicrobiota bacterium]